MAAIALPKAPQLPFVTAPTGAQTLVEVLDWHLNQHPDRLHATVLQDENIVLASLTFGELAKGAHAVAARLIEAEVAPGDRVALMLPTGADFFIAFFGILYAGAVPVPIYPPMQLSKIEEFMRRQAGILRNADARILVTVPEALRFASVLRGLVPTIDAVRSVQSLSVEGADIQLPILRDSAATALIQYTSGSTGDPKGVVLSHANLLANIRSIGQVIEASSADVFVSWLPLYHDMGLIGAWLGSLYFAAPLYVMSPLSFLGRPQSWLWAMHRFRATISAAPNFAFELCATKIADADLAGLDLSTLRLLADGAEPVSVNTLRRFTERFERHGFRPGAMAPVYGLAENAVALAMPSPGRGPLIDRVSREALSRNGKAEPAKPDDPNMVEIVSCGQPLPDHEVRIIDELGREVGDRSEGRLEFEDHPRPRVTFTMKPKPLRCSTTVGSTAATGATSRMRMFSLRAAPRTSSYARDGTSIRMNWKKRSATSTGCGRAASQCSACSTPVLAPSVSSSSLRPMWSNRWPPRACGYGRRRLRPKSAGGSSRADRSCPAR